MSAETLILILALDRGRGLDSLTEHRTKAAIPYGGKYRVIDFVLANCLHSGLRQVLVLSQYKSHSLHKHLRDGWSLFNAELGEFITPVPPQMRGSQEWYAGPFDAIRQNRYLIERNRAKQILVLDGGAVYRMDYAELVRAHGEMGARLTLAVRAVRAPGTGTQARVRVGEDQQVREILPPGPLPTLTAVSDPDAPEHLESMGVHVLDKGLLLELLERIPRGSQEDTDLTMEVVAPLLGTEPVHAYRFGETRGRVSPDRYWSDLCSIDAYYESNLGLLLAAPPLDLYQPDWNIHTYQGQYPPARTVPGALSGNEGIFVNSMLAAGTVIHGGGVNQSILFPRVHVDDGAIVEASILFDGVRVGEGAHLRRCIVEKDVRIPPRERIGFDLKADKTRFALSAGGVVVVQRGAFG